MSEVLAPDTLEKLADFTPLQRILLATAGTLQSTLSAYFGAPVAIKLLSQKRLSTALKIAQYQRAVDLVCRGQAVCHAQSWVGIEEAEIAQMVEAGEVGLGQILEQKGLRPAFTLEDVGQGEAGFWRTYALWAPGVEYRIKETFQKVLYEK